MGPETERSSSHIVDRQELEQFKRDIDLSAYAASRGYQVDQRESSRRTRVMRRDGDKVSISRMPDGHWVYYSFRDLDDNGSIIDFVQKRNRKGLGQVRQELREWTHTVRDLPQFARVPLQPITKDVAQIEGVIARAKVVDSHPYLEARGLRAATLSHPRFRGTWLVATGFYRDGRWIPLQGDRGNVLFPHHNEHGLSGYEAKNRGFTGFAPGGEKALWASRARSDDRVLVLTESAIDALSHHELNPNPRARYISFAGQLNPKQPALVERVVARMPAGSLIVAATDRDNDGHEFARRIADICSRHPNLSFARAVPSIGKDWNDQLQALRSPRRAATRDPGLER